MDPRAPNGTKQTIQAVYITAVQRFRSFVECYLKRSKRSPSLMCGAFAGDGCGLHERSSRRRQQRRRDSSVLFRCRSSHVSVSRCTSASFLSCLSLLRQQSVAPPKRFARKFPHRQRRLTNFRKTCPSHHHITCPSYHVTPKQETASPTSLHHAHFPLSSP